MRIPESMSDDLLYCDPGQRREVIAILKNGDREKARKRLWNIKQLPAYQERKQAATHKGPRRKKMKLRYWKTVERHPLSAEYEDIKGAAWKDFLENLREHGIVDGRKVVLHDGKVIDGWQLQRACVETDIKPDYRELKLPKGMTVEEYVSTVQDHRRHETQEAAMKRASERRERVLTARQSGQSIRTIAENEGVGVSQVARDLDAADTEEIRSGVPGGTGETKDSATQSEVTGRDGKTYAASVLCERCKRVGPVDGCPACADLRTKKPRTSKPKTDKDGDSAPKDAFGNELPKRCRDAYGDPWVQNTFDLLSVMSEKIRKARIGDGMRKRAKHYPFFVAKDVVDGANFIVQYLDDLMTHLKDNRPAGVCPKCDGAGCADCMKSGLVPRKLYAELKKASK